MAKLDITEKRVEELSPDIASFKQAKPLTKIEGWKVILNYEGFLIGETTDGLVQSLVDTSNEPFSFKCNCIARKFPCKHNIALMLLAIQQDFPNQEPETWAMDWISTRLKKQTTKSDITVVKIVEEKPVKNDKLIEKNEKLQLAAIQELELWLKDKIKKGLVELESHGSDDLDRLIRRMNDAKATGLAGHLKELSLALSASKWEDKTFYKFAQLFAICLGSQKENLAQNLSEEIANQIGRITKEDKVFENPSINDTWIILGQTREKKDQLTIIRTWFWGMQTQEIVIYLDFIHDFGSSNEKGLIPGKAFEGSLCKYPGLAPNRVAIKSMKTLDSYLIPNGQNITNSWINYLNLKKEHLWLDRFPMIIENASLTYYNETFYIVDVENNSFELSNDSLNKLWTLFIMTLDHKMTIVVLVENGKFKVITAFDKEESIRI